MRKNRLLLLLALLMTAATGAWATETTVTWSSGDTYENNNSKDGVTLSGDIIQYDGYEWLLAYNAEKGTFTTELGNFTKIEITGGFTKGFSGEGWSSGRTWTGNAAAVPFEGYMTDDNGENPWTITFTIEPASAAATGYTVSMKDGVKDADKWTITPNPAEEGQTVTLQYTGRLKVKSVTATTDAKPAAPSFPDGALNGKFSVSSTKQVYFSKGNLQATYNGSNWSWAFAEHQWDYIGNAAGNTMVTASSPYISENATVDLFGWVGAACEWTGAAQYGISNVKTSNQYGNVEGEALKSDWGTLAITNGGNTANFGWHSLASSEWEYLFITRTTPSGVSYAHATVNSVPGLVLLPDDWSIDYYSLNKVNNATGTAYTDNVISSSDWTSKLEAHGAVFLPAGGYRSEATVSDAGVQGTYWSSTSSTNLSALGFYFRSGIFAGNTQNFTRNRGCSVRLVQATSDAPAKPAATVTTAPTGAEIVGVGKSTALVSGGAADGGTLWYAVTTTNTKPTSTAGFSDAVPTAETIKASGKVYVWYFVKADDTHSDSEIAATAIEVPVADIIWDVTNISDLIVEGTDRSYEKEGVTLSGNADRIYAQWIDYGDPTADGIEFEAEQSGGYKFTAPTGKAFTKIEMKAQGSDGWEDSNLGTGWAFNNTTVTWKGSAAASTVELLTDDIFAGAPVKSIAFTVEQAAPAANIVDLSTLTADYEAQNGDVLTGKLGKKVKISIADGATVTLDNATIKVSNSYDDSYSWAGLNCLGNATIVLKDGTTNTVRGFYENYPGIHVPAGSKLTIQGGTEGTGKLTASPFDGGGTEDSYGAGIGGGHQIACGDIDIQGGIITATGGMYAAGIGGGDATCGNISITGGTVTAMGGRQGAGIGSGDDNTCGNITIASTVKKVTATAGEYAPHSIGAGEDGTCGTVTIGGTKYWENNAAVNGGDTYLATSPLIYDPSN